MLLYPNVGDDGCEVSMLLVMKSVESSNLKILTRGLGYRKEVSDMTPAASPRAFEGPQKHAMVFRSKSVYLDYKHIKTIYINNRHIKNIDPKI
jgi:hypothetical protein